MTTSPIHFDDIYPKVLLIAKRLRNVHYGRDKDMWGDDISWQGEQSEMDFLFDVFEAESIEGIPESYMDEYPGGHNARKVYENVEQKLKSTAFYLMMCLQACEKTLDGAKRVAPAIIKMGNLFPIERLGYIPFTLAVREGIGLTFEFESVRNTFGRQNKIPFPFSFVREEDRASFVKFIDADAPALSEWVEFAHWRMDGQSRHGFYVPWGHYKQFRRERSLP